VPVESIKDFQAKLTEYLTSRKAELLARIAKEKALDDALIAALKAAVVEFKQTYASGAKGASKPRAAV
jgi:F-type H+-transporting ATPase subunit alpha